MTMCITPIVYHIQGIYSISSNEYTVINKIGTSLSSRCLHLAGNIGIKKKCMSVYKEEITFGMWPDLKDQVAVSLGVKFYVIGKCLTREVTLKRSPKKRKKSGLEW